MKKIILSAVAFTILFSCQNDENIYEIQSTESNTVRSCATQEVLEAQLKADPSLALKRNEIEAFTQKAMLTKRIENNKVIIPVVVNVLQRTDEVVLSDDQIKSQIKVLNEDFTATNSDFSKILLTEFAGVAANIDITFELVGTVRKSTTKTSWGTRDTMKNAKRGGINPTAPNKTLNIWVCKIGGGILGYAQFPGGSLATDGIVIDTKYFGLSAANSYPYNLGRTATHEVGHWMNLRHIWGDTTCGSDLVTDTPTHNTANYGVPLYPHLSTCNGTPIEMTMNYMDYTDDRGMYMFTKGQKTRAAALFVTGGARSDFGI
jgi:hypothetical protein